MSKAEALNAVVDLNPVALGLNKVFSSSKLLSNISTYFAQLFANKMPVKAQKFFFTVGALAITFKVVHSVFNQFQMWKWVPGHFSNRKNVTEEKLKQKYGDCYAVVTGCTEGIGLSYAIEFARRGFGVVMVARNKEKLQKRIAQIKAIFPGFKYQIVLGDLSNMKDIKRVSEQLVELSRRIDIGIVINNAGFAGTGFNSFITKDVKSLKDIFTINFVQVYHINAVLLPILRNRKQRSAILNISSCSGYFIAHGAGTYSSSKVALDIYSRTLSIENRDKIDVLSVRPFGVKTPMMDMKKGKFMITPQDCVISSLADLGISDDTWTGFMHKIQASFMEKFNEEQRLQIFDKMFTFKKN